MAAHKSNDSTIDLVAPTRNSDPNDRLNILSDYFRRVIDSMHDHVMVIDSDYRITDANAAFLHQTGCTREEVIGRPCYEVAYQFGEPCASLDRVCPLLKTLKQGELIQTTHVYSDQDGKRFVFDVTGVPMYDEEGKVIQAFAVCRDITTQFYLEAQLAAIYTMGQELVRCREEKQIAKIVVNTAKRVLEVQYCHLWLIDEDEMALVCQDCAQIKEKQEVSQLPLDGAMGIPVVVVRTGEAMYLPDVSQDQRHVSCNKTTRSELCVPIKIGERVVGVLASESDKLDAFTMDDRRLFNELADQASLAIENARLFETVSKQRDRLRTLAVRLAEAEEAERQRLARELHDQVGSNLIALSINLGVVCTQLPSEIAKKVHERLGDSQELIGQITECIRNVMAELHPPVLDNHGISAALRWYGSQISSRAGIPVEVNAEEVIPRLAPLVEIALFRIAQEALTNVVKHAHARRVQVTLHMEGKMLHMIISDNGIGFNPAHPTVLENHQGWGLLSMVERAESVGGFCSIESKPGQGTRVVVKVPR